MLNITLPIGTKKIIFEKSKIKDEVTKKKSDFCKYYEIELKTNNIKQDESYNAYLFHTNKLFFVVDVDSEPALNYVNALIKKHKIKDIQSTKSISNFKDVNNFKFHLYFKNNLNIESNKSFGKLELFINKLIFEDAKRFNNNINLNDLPDLNEDFYKDLGWPALGDEYCNVGRRRSWTWIKLMLQRAEARPLGLGPWPGTQLDTKILTGIRTWNGTRRPPRNHAQGGG